MSLTEQIELAEHFQVPRREKHHPNFGADVETCDWSTGHCTNTTACQDCRLYQSVMKVREYEAYFQGDY